MKHTAEPWRIDDELDVFTGGLHICGDADDFSNGAGICGIWDGKCELSKTELNANAQRIVSCVNACAGIDTAFLIAWAHGVKQNNGKPWDQRLDENLSEIQRLKQQLAETRARAVAMLDLLDDIHQHGLSNKIVIRITTTLNKSEWVDL
jgi:hypothetical protein